MKTENEEISIQQVIERVRNQIMETVTMRGEIDRITLFGNSHIIKFKDGSIYIQPSISCHEGAVKTLEQDCQHQFGGTHVLSTGNWVNCCKCAYWLKVN